MVKMKQKKPWFRPKGYTHFSKKIHSEEQEKFIRSYVKNTAAIARHSFYPLIHRVMKQRRFKDVGAKDEDGHSIRAHKYVDEHGILKSTIKERQIYYATHLDAQIYSYYANEILGKMYENHLRDNPELAKCICAYRRIPSEDGKRNKYNVHFAKDVFDYIKNKGECTAIGFDVSKFFDSLNHSYLKKAWCRLLETCLLPSDHYNIYKSLTMFSYVEFDHLLKEFRIPHEKELRRNDVQSFCDNPKEFRERVRDKGLIKKNPYRDAHKKIMGIPQGTALSAFLANLYMLEFDTSMFNFIVGTHKGMYRRYSDDIVVVCSSENKQEVEEFVISLINQFHLVIQTEKDVTSNFKKNQLGVLEVDKPLRYLGFEFDGQRPLLKSSSLSKFYRNLKVVVKIKAEKARKKGEKIFKTDIYRRFSHLGGKRRKRNYISYAFDAAKIMGEKAIRRQVARAWGKLNSEIKKYEDRYGLPKYK